MDFSFSQKEMEKKLILQAKQIPSTNNFFSQVGKEESDANWKKKCSLLKEAIEKFDSGEAKELYKTALESKKYSVDNTDFLIDGYTRFDVKEIREFFWIHLAMEDEKAREELSRAYIEGFKVPLDPIKGRFWKLYKSK